MNEEARHTGPGADRIWQDALTAAAILAVAPAALGGAVVRAGAGPVREQWLARLRAGLGAEAPVVRMPAQIGGDRLIGGLDLAATLKAGRPVRQRGLIAQADGGVIIAAMAERIGAGTAAAMCAALDSGDVAVERDGLSLRDPACISVIALDESEDGDAGLAGGLESRLAFAIDLRTVPWQMADAAGPLHKVGDLAEARQRWAAVEAGEEAIGALVATAVALGVGSLRAPLFALTAARISAALAGRGVVDGEDLQTAARLVLAPRATQVPQMSDTEVVQEELDQPPDPPTDGGETDGPAGESSLEEVVLDAARAALPAGLLEAIATRRTGRQRGQQRGGSVGAKRRSPVRGRPVGTMRGELGRGLRLDIVETLRTAAPWQRLRDGGRRTAEHAGGRETRIEVRAEDFRFKRFEERSEALTVFVVDASGSTALNRLAEAKGAVELLLASCYARRDHVALVALRGRKADLILPPTRALARAKRSLAGLPGGGGTPLASGIDEALRIALDGRRRDQSPTLVFLTDGAANVARDGRTGRRRGEEDALLAARQVVRLGVAAILIDSGPRPSPFAAELATAMDARYVALPMADAQAVSRIVGGVTGDG